MAQQLLEIAYFLRLISPKLGLLGLGLPGLICQDSFVRNGDDSESKHYLCEELSRKSG